MKEREYTPLSRPYRVIQLGGRIFGKLRVIECLGSYKKAVYWRVECECGQRLELPASTLTYVGQANCWKCSEWRHGMAVHGAETAEYTTWVRMKKRCFNAGTASFDRYGGRGITVCNRWKHDAVAFARDIGTKPSEAHSIDRINTNGHYSCGKCEECIKSKWPMNVHWATAKEQANNRSNTVLLSLKGETHTIAVWSYRTGLPTNLIRSRRRLSWSDARILTTPVRS